MRKSLFVLGAAFAFALSLAGCGGDDGAQGPPGPTGATGPAGPRARRARLALRERGLEAQRDRRTVTSPAR